MKLKKYTYLIVLTLMLVLGINRTYADSEKVCYYISNDNNFKTTIRIGYNKETANPNKVKLEEWARTTIFKTGDGKSPLSTYEVENWFKAQKINGIKIPSIYSNSKEANNDTNPTCPRYIIYTSCPGWFFGLGTSEATFATNSSSVASSAVNASSNCSYAKYASNYKDGKQITKELFFSGLEHEGLIKYDATSKEYTCETMTELIDGEIKNMLNDILGYIRIIVPILIILLGSIDFAKAVIAGKEDNMKKAQSDFIKRVIAGVAVFLVPTLVDVIMWFAEIAWQGTSYVPCNLL